MSLAVEAAKFIGLGAADYLAIPALVGYGAKRAYSNMASMAVGRPPRGFRHKRQRVEGRPAVPGVDAGGMFQGRFRGRKTYREKGSIFSKIGYMQHRESAGVQNLSNCVYLGAASFNADELLHVAAIAMLRRLFKKYAAFHQEFQDADSYIQPTNVVGGTTAINIFFQFVRTSDQFVTSFIAGDASSVPLSNWFNGSTSLWEAGRQLAGVIRGMYVNASQPSILTRIGGYQVVNGEAISVFSDDVTQWKYHLYSNVSLKIQAITPADDGAVLNATDITSNPLQGRLYRFSGITPEIRDFGNMLPGSAPDWGLNNLTKLSANTGLIETTNNPTDAWRNPPSKAMFNNCKYFMDVRLQPGKIKYSVIRFKFRGILEKLLLGFYGSTDSFAPSTQGSNVTPFGTSMLFAFEKVMRTGSDQVKINYAHDVATGGFCVPKSSVRINTETRLSSEPAALPLIP